MAGQLQPVKIAPKGMVSMISSPCRRAILQPKASTWSSIGRPSVARNRAGRTSNTCNARKTVPTRRTRPTSSKAHAYGAASAMPAPARGLRGRRLWRIAMGDFRAPGFCHPASPKISRTFPFRWVCAPAVTSTCPIGSKNSCRWKTSGPSISAVSAPGSGRCSMAKSKRQVFASANCHGRATWLA